jgi:GGDEF domain-containing protein
MARHAIMLTDEVTGLYNQRGFLEIAGRQGRLATEHGLPVSVWLVECAAGNGSEEDVTLAALHVAERLRGAAEDTDVLARWDERRFAALRLSDSPSWTERFGGGIPVQSIRVRIPADHPFELTSALAAAERALCQNKQERA